MKTVRVCVWTFMLMAGSLKPAFSQTPEGLLERPSSLSTWFAAQAGGAAARSEDEETQLYERGTQALDQRRWDRAQQLFDDVIKLKGRRIDGALYWKAYAQNKQGQRPEALATLAALRSGHPQSRWLKDAAVLEVEVRQASGQSVSPEKTGDEELKLIAINSLLHSDSREGLADVGEVSARQPAAQAQRASAVRPQPERLTARTGDCGGNCARECESGVADASVEVSGTVRRQGKPAGLGRHLWFFRQRRGEEGHLAQLHGGGRERTRAGGRQRGIGA